MCVICDIRQVPGFDQESYNNLIQQAQTQKVDTGLVDSLLLNAIKGGKSFDQALALVGSDLPNLSPPKSSTLAPLNDWPAIPSPGALIMSVVTEYAAEQRQQNQELMWAETEAITQSMKDQAKEMRNAAVTQLVLGCVSGAVQITVGAVQVAGGIYAAKSATTAANKAAEAATKGMDSTTAAYNQAHSQAFSGTFASKLTQANIHIGAVGQMGGGVAGMIGAGGQYVAADMQAKAKEMEADQEKMRAMRESIKNLDEGLRELIRKSLAAQNEIQASTNQARAKILA